MNSSRPGRPNRAQQLHTHTHTHTPEREKNSIINLNMSGVFCFSVAFAYIHICKDSNATGRVIQWEKADRKLNRRASKSTWSYTDTIESQFGESAMDEDKVVGELFLSLNKLITQLRMYRAPIFPCCFLFRLQMKKQKRNKKK
jgi:hypothetical protein